VLLQRSAAAAARHTASAVHPPHHVIKQQLGSVLEQAQQEIAGSGGVVGRPDPELIHAVLHNLLRVGVLPSGQALHPRRAKTWVTAQKLVQRRQYGWLLLLQVVYDLQAADQGLACAVLRCAVLGCFGLVWAGLGASLRGEGGGRRRGSLGMALAASTVLS
jgi:hypothetical protein